MEEKTKVLIVGAGFGGIALAKKLSRNKDFEVILIDKHNYHTFQPLLYQVATGGLEPDSIAYPIRRIFRGYKNFFFRMAEVTKVLPEENAIETNIGRMEYDFLVLAMGSKSNYFNFESNKEQFMGMKTVPDALDMRSYIMQNLERATVKMGNQHEQAIINMAIVGGGPTGVELAGSLAEMKHYVLPKDFPELDTKKLNIYLFEAAPKLLAAMSEQSSAAAFKYLKKLGVNVHLDAMVSAYDGKKITLKSGDEFLSETVIWTAGVKGNPIEGINKEAIQAGNRIRVNRFSQVEGHENVFAIGDVALMFTERYPKGHPQLAPAAIQHGEHLAKNLVRKMNGKQLVQFKYTDKGSMATVGRLKAVVDLPQYKFQGMFAWWVWMFVHLMSLVGFRNKVIAFFDWSYNYFTYDRPLGLIIRPFRRK